MFLTGKVWLIILGLFVVFVFALKSYWLSKVSESSEIYLNPVAEFPQAVSSTKGNLASTNEFSSELTEAQNDSKSALELMYTESWKLQGSLMEHYQHLLENARSGDAKSAYLLARSLFYCFNSPQSATQLERRLDETAKYSDSSFAIENLNEKYHYCEGLDSPQKRSYFAHLKNAAELGSVPAQEFIGRISPEFYMTSQGFIGLDRETYIQTRDEFVKGKLKYLEHAGRNGNMRALTQLSRMYHSQNYGKDSLIKLFAINNLILETTTNNDAYNRYNWFVQKQYDELSIEQREQAYAITEQWLNDIFSNGTLYPIE